MGVSDVGLVVELRNLQQGQRSITTQSINRKRFQDAESFSRVRQGSQSKVCHWMNGLNHVNLMMSMSSSATPSEQKKSADYEEQQT